jgi:nicotinate phosphoribosyltransferase
MSNAYFQLYRDSEGTFTFNDRNNEKYDDKFLEMLKLEFARICQLKLTMEEYAYISSIRYLSTNYTEWLKGFQFEFDKINCFLDDEKHLHIEVTDKMYKVTLYEVPILATVAECRNKYLGVNINMKKIIDILDKKIDFANEHQLYFSEFGTRRRASAASHEAIVQRLKERCPIYCVGTSNVYFAMKYNMMPSGTCAHEWIMFHAGIGGFKTANLNALNDWISVYQGDLGISLIDTYTTASYLHTLTLKQAKLLDGFRQDSGDEFKIGNMIIDKLREMRIDPTSKTIVFSNALNFEKYAEIARYFKGRIKVSAGIGTNLTCDLGIDGYKPANIVMKLSKCRINKNQEWRKCIKISDDLGKHLGDNKEFEIAKYQLGIEISDKVYDNAPEYNKN